MTHYIGILDGNGDVWGVRIPDCPGAYGGGATTSEAITSAIVGLRVWAEATIKDGDPLPVARTLQEIAADEESAPQAGEVAVMIPLLLDAGRTVRANLTFDAGLLSAIDEEATRRGITRSAFLASAAREKIEARH